MRTAGTSLTNTELLRIVVVLEQLHQRDADRAQLVCDVLSQYSLTATEHNANCNAARTPSRRGVIV